MSRRVYVVGAVVLLAAAATSWIAVGARAQDEKTTPTPSFRITLIAQAPFTELPPGEVLLTASSVTIPSGTATQPIVADRGPIVIRVQKEAIVLDADLALVTTVIEPIGPLLPELPAPARAEGRVVGSDEQIVLPMGSSARVSNPGPDRAELTMVTITGEDVGAAAVATPLASRAAFSSGVRG
jgi:hypothetical protein